MTITMWDSIEVGQIPRTAQAVAGYTGGIWQTYKQLVKEFPNAHRLSIAVRSQDDAECLDVEPGDATNATAPSWVKRQLTRGIHRPCVYTSLSNVDALLHALEQNGIRRSQIRIWSAHYTGNPHICGPSEGISTHADATQYFDHALGRNLDVSLCEDSFFGSPSPPSTYIPEDEARWEREFDVLKGRKGPWPALRRRVLIRVMLHRQREIVARAWETGWGIRNRHARYRLLMARTGKT